MKKTFFTIALLTAMSKASTRSPKTNSPPVIHCKHGNKISRMNMKKTVLKNMGLVVAVVLLSGCVSSESGDCSETMAKAAN
ncbi:MAG: hypothetical protein IKD10_10920, partial [Lentisphaeria bacterium]|nr:hypothetical protein [Lentisphaeria bacterium]